jgi:phosphocarrier protein HPr
MSASSETHRYADPAVERTVVLPKHLHARPAGQVSQVAARHPETTVELSAEGRQVNARSVLAVMGLGAVTGTEVTVIAVGPAAEAVTDEICLILRTPETD